MIINFVRCGNSTHTYTHTKFRVKMISYLEHFKILLTIVTEDGDGKRHNKIGKILIIVEPDGYKEFIACFSLLLCIFEIQL